jgi:hypothetical protein
MNTYKPPQCRRLLRLDPKTYVEVPEKTSKRRELEIINAYIERVNRKPAAMGGRKRKEYDLD